MAFLNSTIRNIEKNQELIITEKQKKELEKQEKQQEKYFKDSLKTAKIEALEMLKDELSNNYKTFDFDYAFKYNNSLENRKNILDKIIKFYPDYATKFEILPYLEYNYLKINKQLYTIYKNDFLFQQEEASRKNTNDLPDNNIKISDFLYYMFKTVIIILIFPFLILLFAIK